jgi:hypothetical protein
MIARAEALNLSVVPEGTRIFLDPSPRSEGRGSDLSPRFARRCYLRTQSCGGHLAGRSSGRKDSPQKVVHEVRRHRDLPNRHACVNAHPVSARPWPSGVSGLLVKPPKACRPAATFIDLERSPKQRHRNAMAIPVAELSLPGARPACLQPSCPTSDRIRSPWPSFPAREDADLEDLRDGHLCPSPSGAAHVSFTVG